jgi:hydrogenase nickel incorporation protein HypB
MCATCGCDGERHEHEHSHDHGHAHDHQHHAHDHAHDLKGRVIRFEADVLARNREIAESNRRELGRRGVAAFNLMSSPGAGKTTLLERTLRGMSHVAVIEGDQATQADADRIRAAGGRAVQINTGTGCHLDATMVARALAELDPKGGVVFIENVGNLVCPALFDLGELARVVIASVTEGEDKPLKYPHMFRAAELVLLNKVDLLPHVEFSVERFTANARKVHPRVRILPLSAKSGAGFDAWLGYVADRGASARV